MFSTILKNMSSSVGMIKIPIYGKIIQMVQTTNQYIYVCIYIYIPSGKRLHNYGKSPFLMGKLTISMAFCKHPQTSPFVSHPVPDRQVPHDDQLHRYQSAPEGELRGHL